MQGIGPLAFIAGIIIAILAGLFSTFVAGYAAYIGLLLVILGLIVGFMNITDKEVVNFLIASIALMATSAIGWPYLDIIGMPIGTMIGGILSYIGVFVAPAAVVVAIQAIYKLAKD